MKRRLREKDNIMAGLIHLYTGDGKGKTTAAMGLAVRAAGCGFKPVVAQFLKSGKTGELESLSKLGIPVIRSEKQFGFSFNMDEETKEKSRSEQAGVLDEAIKTVKEGGGGLLVLDEAVGAVSAGLLDEEKLRRFIETKPENLEVVMTGRDPKPWMMEIADYHTCMRKEKHPFDCGVAARTGIEK